MVLGLPRSGVRTVKKYVVKEVAAECTCNMLYVFRSVTQMVDGCGDMWGVVGIWRQAVWLIW